MPPDRVIREDDRDDDPMNGNLPFALVLFFGLLFLLALSLEGCSAPEQRQTCTVAIHDHPTLPRPAGRIKVRCDGLDRATIDARRVHAE